VTTVALNDLTKVFDDGTIAVDNVNLTVANGEFLVLVGPSGCGKSTILRMVAGLERPTSGAVLLDGVYANDMEPAARGISMIFQNFALYPHLTVEENIGFPLRLSGVDPSPRAERVGDVAGALGVADLLARRPHQLSGGQRQRVAMGRAIARRPQLFLMDEPLSNLDSGLRATLRAEILSLTRELGVTTLYVTHDQAEALTLADRVAVLRRGVIQDVGTPTQVYGQPATLYVAAFLGSPRMNLLEAAVHVHLDRYVALHLGAQAVQVPWRDPRSRVLARYHGEKLVLGVRAEALLPVPAGTGGPVLHGTVRYLEHHGHETLAYLDIGAVTVTVEEVAGPPPAPARPARPRLIDGLTRRWPGRARDPEPVAAGTPPPWPARRDRSRRAPQPAAEGAHRRVPGELAVRLEPYPALAVGDPLAVAVRLDAVHFFDRRGQRIDPAWR